MSKRSQTESTALYLRGNALIIPRLPCMFLPLGVTWYWGHSFIEEGCVMPSTESLQSQEARGNNAIYPSRHDSRFKTILIITNRKLRRVTRGRCPAARETMLVTEDIFEDNNVKWKQMWCLCQGKNFRVGQHLNSQQYTPSEITTHAQISHSIYMCRTDVRNVLDYITTAEIRFKEKVRSDQNIPTIFE